MQLMRTWAREAAFSEAARATKTFWRSGLRRVSMSRRTISGSRRPALANCASAAGSVALTRSVWRESGSILRIRRSCSAKPISKRRSASSKTTISTLASESDISWMRCHRRPGVAITTSGAAPSAANWLSRPSPPTTSVCCRSVCFPIARENLRVWIARSRVGLSTSARIPSGACACSRCSIGTRNAAVLPLPVRAIATTSFPFSATGITFRWIGVGTR